MRSEQGLDKPLPILYWTWLRSAATGSWGFSFAYNGPAGPILWPRVRNTLLLSICALLLAWAIALPAGIGAAAEAGSWADLLVSGAVAVLLAIPEVVLALILLLFAVRSHYFSPGGSISLDVQSVTGAWAQAENLLKHLFLPAVCISAGLLPLLISHVRAAMAETLRSPFVTAARSFGIPYRRILLRHVLPAASNPLISLLGLSLGLLMSSSLLVEAVFSWPGLGQLMLQAIGDRDIFLIVDAAIIAAGFLVLGNFAADVFLYFSDPRIRTK